LDVRPSNNANPIVHKDTPRRRRSSSIESESESKPIIENREAGSNIQTSEKSKQNDISSATMIPENNHYKSTSDDDDDDSVTLENNANDDKNKTDDIRPKKRRSKIGKQVSDVAKFNINKKSLGDRFRQGVLAVVATERLEKMVKRAPLSPPPTNILSMSSRLIEMYLPSDEEKEDDDKNSDDDDSSDDDSCCDENSECPVCLGLVKSSQHRKIILLRRMLCKRCFDTHYIQRGVKHRKSHGTSAIPKGKESRSLEGTKTNCESKERQSQKINESIGTKRSSSRRKKSTSKQTKDTELITSAKKEKSIESKSRNSTRASKTDDALPSTFRSITENEIKVSGRFDKKRIEEKLLARRRATQHFNAKDT